MVMGEAMRTSAVSRTMSVGVALVAALCLAAAAKRPPPPAPDTNGAGVTISLTRGACFGTCPIYRVTIHGDGSSIYDGERFVAVAGHREYQVPAASVAKLVADFEAANFFALEDEYRARVTDLPTYTLSITIGERSKTVVDYFGRQIGMPQAVTDLEDETDLVGETAQFVKGAPAN
jgi:hypothetical protein